ncbi:hypothetical protein Hrubri_3498 [Herbaspirillum rubrisubalbicans M1]|nr:hypothetical protein Hrubri_3498 [Herbaspirillum rubrisubalbicans M1]
MGNLCSSGVNTQAHMQYDHEAPPTPVQHRGVASTAAQSPLRQAQGRTPFSTPSASPLHEGQRSAPFATRPRTPANAIELRIRERVGRMAEEVDGLILRTYGVQGLDAQYRAAVRVRDQITRRVEEGDVLAGAPDDFTQRISRINRQVNLHYAQRPDAPVAPPPTQQEGRVNAPAGVRTRASGSHISAETLRRMEVELDGLINISQRFEQLDREYRSATRLRDQIRQRLAGVGDQRSVSDLVRAIARVNLRVSRYYTQNPDVLAIRPSTSRDNLVNVPRQAFSRTFNRRSDLPPPGVVDIPLDILIEASNRLLGVESMEDGINMSGRENLNILAHLQDINSRRTVSGEVVDAAQRAHHDPAVLVNNLLSLVRENPPVLSWYSRNIE